jgi:hypothetical protein
MDETTRDAEDLRSRLGMLSEGDIAVLANVSTETLANWRAQRSGPPWFKLGRSFLYPVAELLKWAAGETHYPQT